MAISGMASRSAGSIPYLVFTKDVIETWLNYKRDKEIDAIRLRPHPYEFHLYYDI